jgi:phosphohistidine phosphatase
MHRMRTLVVIRHAEAGHPPGRADHDRVLNARGREEAASIGPRIAAAGASPTLIVTSTAHRAHGTAEVLAADLAGATVWAEPALYLAGADELADRVRQLPDEHAAVAFVGHNPGLQQLVWVLAREADRERVQRFPTGAVALLDADGPWASVAEGACRLSALSFPR